MTSTSEPAQQQASPSPGVMTQDEVTVASPAPLDPAASQAEGVVANPGPGASAGGDFATSVVADRTNAVPGVASARRVLTAGLGGEALRMVEQFDKELEEAGWYEDPRIYRGASAEQLLRNVFGGAWLDTDLVRQVRRFTQ